MAAKQGTSQARQQTAGQGRQQGTTGRHRAAPTVADRQRRVRAAAEGDTRIPLPSRVRGPRTASRPRRYVTPYGAARGAVRGTGKTVEAVAGGAGGRYSHALMAELLMFFVLVGLRTVNEYVPFDQGQPTEGTGPGAVVPKSGQAGVVAILVGGLGTWFVLSLISRAGEQWARASAWFGALVLLGLAFASQDELVAAAGWLDVAHKQAAAPTVVGTTAPIVVTGGSSTTSGSTSSGTGQNSPPPTLSNPGAPFPSTGKCPKGYTYDPKTRKCWPNAVGFAT